MRKMKLIVLNLFKLYSLIAKDYSPAIIRSIMIRKIIKEGQSIEQFYWDGCGFEDI